MVVPWAFACPHPSATLMSVTLQIKLPNKFGILFYDPCMLCLQIWNNELNREGSVQLNSLFYTFTYSLSRYRLMCILIHDLEGKLIFVNRKLIFVNINLMSSQELEKVLNNQKLKKILKNNLIIVLNVKVTFQEYWKAASISVLSSS